MENPITYLLTPTGTGTAVAPLYDVWSVLANVQDARGPYVREDAYSMKESDLVRETLRPVDGVPSWLVDVLREDGWPTPYFREDQK